MRIATWNVEYAAVPEKNRRRLRRILEMDCDIWVLTETNDDLSLGVAYRSVSTTPRPHGREGSRWVTIWSRLPIVCPVPVEDLCRTVAAVVAAPLGNILVYGTVLPWHSDGGPAGDARAWAEHHRVIPLQAAEWARLRRDYPDAALCVAGDLNMNLGGPHWYGTAQGRRLLRAGLEAAGLACVTESDRIPIGLLSHGPIDHICVSNPLAARASFLTAWEGTDDDGVRLSDHSGVAVSIEA